MKLVAEPVGTLPRQYDIEVPSRNGQHAIYRTRRLIFDAGSQRLRGRGTRVWEAVLLENGVESGDSVVLKDSWVDSALQREGDVLEKFREQVTATADPQKKALLDQLFLTVLAHAEVSVERTGEHNGVTPDSTKADLIPAGFYAKAVEGQDAGADAIRDVVERTPLTYRSKVHYRIVFKEVCTPIGEETSLNKILRSMFFMCLGQSNYSPSS